MSTATPVAQANAIAQQLNVASAAAEHIVADTKHISWATRSIQLCADASQSEIRAAACDQSESPAATLETIQTIREIARAARAIILDADPAAVTEAGAILEPDPNPVNPADAIPSVEWYASASEPDPWTPGPCFDPTDSLQG